MVYWLKPIPVKVTVAAGSPALSPVPAVRLEAVTIGASVPASPPPKAPLTVNVVPLHRVVAEPEATVIGTLSDVTLVTLAGPAGVVTPAQVPNVTAAPNSKPAPAIVTVVVDDPVVGGARADGLSALIPYAVIVKPVASVVLPPSGFVTVMS